jgi:hypothetical protein
MACKGAIMKYGDWTVLQILGKDEFHQVLAECQCKCGLIKIQKLTLLIHGRTKRCVKCKHIDSQQKKHVGKCFNKLEILQQIPGKKSICKCQCGNTKILPTHAVVTGAAKSCGCIESIHRENYDEDIKKKILNSVEITPSGCWEWKKAKHRQGYGNIGYKRKVMLAHRVSWKVFKGELDDNILVCHHCDNPPCVNPDHLFLGTDRDNVNDAFKKGRIKRYKGEDHYFAKLTKEMVLEIRKLASEGMKYAEIAKKLNVKLGNISGIVTKSSWKHI